MADVHLLTYAGEWVLRTGIYFDDTRPRTRMSDQEELRQRAAEALHLKDKESLALVGYLTTNGGTAVGAIVTVAGSPVPGDELLGEHKWVMVSPDASGDAAHVHREFHGDPPARPANYPWIHLRFEGRFLTGSRRFVWHVYTTAMPIPDDFAGRVV